MHAEPLPNAGAPATTLQAVASRPLSLISLPAARVALSNHLLSRAARSQLWTADHLCEWHWHSAHTDPPDAPARSAAIELVSDDATFRLSLQHEGAGVIDTDIDLAVLRGDTLQVGAALRYGQLIDHLDFLSGRRWRVATVLDPNAVDPRPGSGVESLRCAFSVRESGTGTLGAAGRLELGPGAWGVWAAATGDPAAGPACLHALPIPLGVTLASTLALTQAERRDLRRGGAVLLHRAAREGTPCVLRLPNDVGHCRALLRGSELELIDELKAGTPPRPDQPRSHPMDVSALDTGPEAEAPDGDDMPPRPTVLDSVPILLEFHLATLSLPFGALGETLVAGHVFDLGQTLGPQTVTMRANGVAIARGELIQVGDALAVRIDQLLPHGPV
jgi:flagellar motor switch/type III secretory pathway protein FliN